MKLMVRAHDLSVKGAEKINERLCSLDLDGVQLVVYKSIDGISYATQSLSTEHAEKISTEIKKNNKEIALIGAYFNPVHPNEAKVENGIAVFKDYISLAQSLGCSYVGSETGSYNGDPWIYHPLNHSDEALDRVVNTFSSLDEYEEQNGVSIAIGHVCYTPERLLEAVERIGRKNVKFIFDLYNYLDISNVDTVYNILERGLSLFGDRILLFHIKDFVIEDGRLKQCGVGKGTLDFEKILYTIYSSNQDAILVLEGTVGDDLPYAILHLHDIMNKIQNDVSVIK